MIRDKKIRINEGKESYSFNRCFTDMFPALCSFVEKYLDDDELAKDIVQELFTKLWDKFNKFDSDISLKTFLYRSARNAAINHLKHLEVVDKYKQRKLNELNTDKNFLSQILEKETHRLIYQAIEELPDNQKQIIYMNIWGLSNSEIADELQVSVNTVKTQKARAYKKLKKSLQGIYSVLSLLMTS